MNKYEKVREEIATMLMMHFPSPSVIPSQYVTLGTKDALILADRILSLPDILVKDSNQSLPTNPDIPDSYNELACGAEDDIDNVSRAFYLLAQQDMLSNNWVRVVNVSLL